MKISRIDVFQLDIPLKKPKRQSSAPGASSTPCEPGPRAVNLDTLHSVAYAFAGKVADR